MLIGAHEKIEV